MAQQAVRCRPRQRAISTATSYVETGLGLATDPHKLVTSHWEKVHRFRELWLDEMEHRYWILDARRMSEHPKLRWGTLGLYAWPEGLWLRQRMLRHRMLG